MTTNSYLGILSIFIVVVSFTHTGTATSSQSSAFVSQKWLETIGVRGAGQRINPQPQQQERDSSPTSFSAGWSRESSSSEEESIYVRKRNGQLEPLDGNKASIYKYLC